MFRALSETLYELNKQLVKEDMEHYHKMIEQKQKEAREKAEKEAEQYRKELEEHNQYYREYLDDPTSVMICPFGWSPFGIYL
jgi:prephenate dehydrogenase